MAPGVVAIDLNTYSAAQGYGWTAFVGSASESAARTRCSRLDSGSNSFRMDLPTAPTCDGLHGRLRQLQQRWDLVSERVDRLGLDVPGPVLRADVPGGRVADGEMTLTFTDNGGTTRSSSTD